MRLAQDVAAAGVDQAVGVGDEQEAEFACFESGRHRCASRSAVGDRQGVELEAAEEIVREDAEFLPGGWLAT